MEESSKDTSLVPRLLQWSAAITTKVLATHKELGQSQRKALLSLLDSLNEPSQAKCIVCPFVPEKWKVACCLPFILGSVDSSGRGKYREKPMLVLTTTDVVRVQLVEKMSSLHLTGGHLVFSTAGGNAIKLYKVHNIRNHSDATKFAGVRDHYHVVLAELVHFHLLPQSSFSEVIVYGNHCLDLEELRQVRKRFPPDVAVLVFASPPYRHMGHPKGLEPNTSPVGIPPLGVELVKSRELCAGVTLLVQHHPLSVCSLLEIESAWMSDSDPMSHGPEVRALLGEAPNGPKSSEKSKSGRSDFDPVGLEGEGSDSPCLVGDGLAGEKKQVKEEGKENTGEREGVERGKVRATEESRGRDFIVEERKGLKDVKEIFEEGTDQERDTCLEDHGEGLEDNSEGELCGLEGKEEAREDSTEDRRGVDSEREEQSNGTEGEGLEDKYEDAQCEVPNDAHKVAKREELEQSEGIEVELKYHNECYMEDQYYETANPSDMSSPTANGSGQETCSQSGKVKVGVSSSAVLPSSRLEDVVQSTRLLSSHSSL